MNKEEFKLAIEKAFLEFNEGKNYDFLLVAVNRDDQSAIMAGYGCGACMAEEIANNLHKFTHIGNDSEDTVKH